MAGTVGHDFHSLLSSPDRDYLLRNNGEQVKIETLRGKILGLYFSAAWCGPCQRFTPSLVEVYNELSSRGDFEVIFLSADEDDESFNEYFCKMPWLAVPFSDSETRDRLDDLFKVRGIPHLVILDKDWEVLNDSGVDLVQEYGVDGYPFTRDRITHLVEQEEAARRNPSLRSLLVSRSRDFVISSDGKEVPLAELEGKVLGLYFSSFTYGPCLAFTTKLVDIYGKLKTNGERFEIVLIALDNDEESFKQGFRNIPWLALPIEDKRYCVKLVRHFKVSMLPTLVIIGQDGKTLHPNVVEAIEEHGIQTYPFTPEKFAELAEVEKAREEAQTLESILVTGDHDFLIGKDRAKIPVSTLVGRNILLYFSADWSAPCRAFLPKLIEAYDKIKERDDGMEVIFISSDRTESSFNKIYDRMPWLALPFGDPRKESVRQRLKVENMPMLVAIGADGRTVTKDAKRLIMVYGAKAYPFSGERVKELESEIEERAKRWAGKVKHSLHEEHELVLSRRTMTYICDGCEEEGHLWSYLCKDCDFDLHPKCALGTSEAEFSW